MSHPLVPSALTARRRSRARSFEQVCAATAWAGVVVLGLLLGHLVDQGAAWLDLDFLAGSPSRFPENAGIRPALMGTLCLMSLTALFSIPLGVASAIHLEEYAGRGRLARFVEINLANLAGVPSIVYGLLGLSLFVRGVALGRSVLAASLTLTLVVLPVVILTAREAIRAVPSSIRMASYALGASRWQAVRDHVLPAAFPGILTGIILALCRGIGETAPLIAVGALTFVTFVPGGPMDGFTALPILIFSWASRPQVEFHQLAAAAILVLLVVLAAMNAAAVFIRHRTSGGRP